MCSDPVELDAEQLRVLLAQLSVLGDLGRGLRQVGAPRLEATLVGHVVDAVPLLVGRDELESSLLADGASVRLGSREAAAHLINLWRREWLEQMHALPFHLHR